MDRTDSAFDETFGVKAHYDIPHKHRSNNVSAHERRPRKSPSKTSANSQSTTTTRPSLDTRSSTQRKSTEHRGKSTTSSDKSTKLRMHGPNSLPSSRRTSCTIVDPSRPARHYRIKSSQTVPSPTGDIDDVLALHFRSCSLFQNPSYQQAVGSGLPSPALSEPGVGAKDAINTEFGATIQQRPGTAPLIITTPYADDDGSLSDVLKEESEEDTTMHWMSPSTRRDQYKKIDKENRGLSGLVRKILPRCVSGPPTQTFYEKDKSDACSVRRYRVDVEDEEPDVKDASRQQRCKLERTSTNPEARRWGCF